MWKKIILVIVSFLAVFWIIYYYINENTQDNKSLETQEKKEEYLKSSFISTKYATWWTVKVKEN